MFSFILDALAAIGWTIVSGAVVGCLLLADLIYDKVESLIWPKD